VYTSPYPSIQIPHTPLSEFVLTRAASRGRRPALVCGLTGRTITYAELPERVERTAAGLAALGVRKGDVCAIFAPNSPEYVVAVLAIARLGAVATTANPLYTPNDLAKQLEDSGAHVLLTSLSLCPTWSAAIAGTSVSHVVLFDDDASASGNVVSFAALAARSRGAPAVSIDPLDLVVLPYSSGTTGMPKGVMLTHRNLVANILQIDGMTHYIDGEDTTVAFLPFFHIYGLTVIALMGLWAGATLVVMPKFELASYLDLIETHRATFLHVVPPVVVALAKHPMIDGRDFSSVRKLFSGAAPLGAELGTECARRIGCVLQQGYGLTETSPAAIVLPESSATTKLGSIGVPISDTECRVVDPETGRDVPPGVDGEIWIRGPQVMRGYLGRPDETRAAIDDAGWLRTGDIGHVDDEGHFFIVDRLKELIKYKGMQVPPAELEAVLLSHPNVADAAVVPLADVDCGEVPRAFVVPNGDVSAEELMSYVAERVAPYKKLRRLEFIDSIPKSASGKILRRLLKDRPA